MVTFMAGIVLRNLSTTNKHEADCMFQVKRQDLMSDGNWTLEILSGDGNTIFRSCLLDKKQAKKLINLIQAVAFDEEIVK